MTDTESRAAKILDSLDLTRRLSVASENHRQITSDSATLIAASRNLRKEMQDRRNPGGEAVSSQ